MRQLNYHHLRYFWAIARDGNLTRVAERLRVSPSALSSQLRQLEAQLDERLFERVGRTLVLTEAGAVVLAHADTIFEAGEELLATIAEGRSPKHPLRVGASATLSRNFQESFVEPLLRDEGARLQLVAASQDELLERLKGHELDVVLANRPPQADRARGLACRLLARQKVSLIARRARRRFRFPADVEGAPMLLPGAGSALRAGFDAVCERHRVKPRVVAEVDDMAMLRLLTRDTRAVALLPPVVVRDELRSGVLREAAAVPGLYEEFYGITAERKFQHPRLAALLETSANQLLQTHSPRR
ncbi:MAG: LysR family transcriptional regulator [Myxococcaceae bacterium]|nr:LysR family transcriptional regulator [Myxococcaceae bacterium]